LKYVTLFFPFFLRLLPQQTLNQRQQISRNIAQNPKPHLKHAWFAGDGSPKDDNAQ
jgi:hypothetical protein